ncbi:MAG: xanthine dehydrogenase family protein molybdopterin-binding subunit [Rhodospirillales bacterium]|nr:xanthine dehydrogenase family protein molybdopterin-binding subunit [Rhodospirillales bacterium]
MTFTRRKAIIGGIVGGGFLGVGFWFARERDRLGGRTLFNLKPSEAGLNGWVKINRDDSVIVAVPRAEMGQGVQTALAMLVAEEMEARWDQIRIEDPPEDGVYRNIDILVDGLPFSPEEAGTVVDVAHWMAGKLGGVLGVKKVTGAATFGIDVRLPGLLYAAVRNAPTFGGSATAFNLKQGGLPEGVEKVVIVPGGIAAVGKSWWRANKFLDEEVEVQWHAGPEPKLDSTTLWERYAQLLETGEPALTRTSGNESKSEKVQTLTATYRAPYLAHAPMEPMNCTAQIREHEAGKRRLEIWMPNQSPTLMRLAAANAAGLSQAEVTVHTTFLGGGFGRRAEVDLVRQAVTCALALPGRPVQVLWSREEDIRHDVYRPMALARWRADLDTSGPSLKLAGVAKRQVAQSPTDQFPARTIGLPAQGKPEGNAVENPPYAFPAYRLDAIVADGSVPVGFWRSVAPSQGAGYGGEGSWLGHAAAGRVGARPCVASIVRIDRGASLRSRRGRRQDLAGEARHLRHRLRARRQPGDRAGTDGERHYLRPVGRTLWRDHPGRRGGRAGQLPGL